MRGIHYFTASGPLCDPTLKSGLLTIVARTVTCPSCAEALEERAREDLRWAARRPRTAAPIPLIRLTE